MEKINSNIGIHDCDGDDYTSNTKLHDMNFHDNSDDYDQEQIGLDSCGCDE